MSFGLVCVLMVLNGVNTDQSNLSNTCSTSATAIFDFRVRTFSLKSDISNLKTWKNRKPKKSFFFSLFILNKWFSILGRLKSSWNLKSEVKGHSNEQKLKMNQLYFTPYIKTYEKRGKYFFVESSSHMYFLSNTKTFSLLNYKYTWLLSI